MGKLLGGGVLCGLAFVGSVAVAGPTSAGGPPTDVQIDKSEVGRGDVVTLSSIEPCEGSEVRVSVEDPDDVIVETFLADLQENGDWTAEWLVLESDAAGDYWMQAECYFDGTIPSEPYDPARFEVVEYPEVDEAPTLTVSPAVPDVAAPGSLVTVNSVSPCPTIGVDPAAGWELYEVIVDENGEPVDAVLVNYAVVNLNANGQWTASFAAPAKEAVYAVVGWCLRTTYDVDENGEIVGFYAPTGVYDLEFLLVGNVTVPGGPVPVPESPVATPGTPAPAPAAAGKPSLTG